MSVLVQNSTLSCPRCRTLLAPEDFAATHDTACPQCRSTLRAAIFPAFYQAAASHVPGLADRAGEGEAVCFFHAENRAERTCDRCGRFICHVCDMPVGTRRLCPTCLSGALETEKESELVAWRFLWSDSALIFGLVPLLLGVFIWPFIVLTGITAITLGILAGRRAGSLPRGPRHWKAVAGIIGGLLQVLIWGGIVGFLFYGLRQS